METNDAFADVERLKPNGDVSHEDVGRVNDLIGKFNKTAKALTPKIFVRLAAQNDLFVARGASGTPQYGRILGVTLLARIPTLAHGKAGQASEVIVDNALGPDAADEVRKKLIQVVVQHARVRSFEMLYFPHASPEDRSAFRELFTMTRLYESPTWCVNLNNAP